MADSARSVQITETSSDGRPIPLRALLAFELPWVTELDNLSHEWRRPLSELFGTMFLVFAGAGPAVVDALAPGSVPHSLAGVCPATSWLSSPVPRSAVW